MCHIICCWEVCVFDTQFDGILQNWIFLQSIWFSRWQVWYMARGFSAVDAKKSVFMPCEPKLCQRPVCSPRRDGSFPNLGSIFQLFVSELWPYCVKKTWPTRQKSLPSPLHCGAPSASNSLSALSWIRVTGCIVSSCIGTNVQVNAGSQADNLYWTALCMRAVLLSGWVNNSTLCQL